MKKPVSLTCPNCGASLAPKRGASEVQCNYCGTYVFLENVSPNRPQNLPAGAVSHDVVPAGNPALFRFYTIMIYFFYAAVIIGFILTGVGKTADNFWAGVLISGIIGAVTFTRKRKREFSVSYLTALSRLSTWEATSLSRIRTVGIAFILLFLIILPLSEVLSDTLFAALLLAALIGWIVTACRMRQNVREEKKEV